MRNIESWCPKWKMPLLHQPRGLLWSCISSTSEMVIAQTLSSPDHVQEVSTRMLLHKYLAPMLMQDVLGCVLRRLAIHHSAQASPTVISCLLRILLHPRITDLQLSDLSYVGSVELETLDKVELTLMKLLPSMTQLTQLNLSTHLNKITLPSCSSGILEILGRSCPNLTLLNLNSNNRVSGEGLLHLYPTDNQPGCIKLEKLFIQDCSVDPEDVAMLIHFFPNLQIVGYKELGTSLQILKSQPKKFGRRRRRWQYCLKLTHVDNTSSRAQKCDGEIVDFVCETCPDIENLKVRVCDEDVEGLGNLAKLKHLELRFYTGVHHPIGRSTENYFKTHGCHLASLTIYCNRLHSNYVQIIAENCYNLTKLFLHANVSVVDRSLKNSCNKLQKLEVLSLRLGHDELIMSPTACDLVFFLLREAHYLQELYLLVRSHAVHHGFITKLLVINKLSHLKMLIADVARRTLSVPMLELTIETAFLLIDTCPHLQLLGNLICWNVTPEEVAELQSVTKMRNYNLTVIYTQSNKLNDKIRQ
ncbi:uncharacterized protein [Procambarus clarkii]|uniref:uncharacterized protein isoform X2 n=1 Tax=Procambarus clarkii TaxID=6728 RepID=UPI001E6766EB|nr:uncharacterized protein LOC123764331 isoform X2 [Procambarus clarkii]